MKPEFYQVEWENGNTDVFASKADAIQDWENSNTADDQAYGDHIKEAGFTTAEPDPEEIETTDGLMILGEAIWSPAALAKASA